MIPKRNYAKRTLQISVPTGCRLPWIFGLKSQTSLLNFTPKKFFRALFSVFISSSLQKMLFFLKMQTFKKPFRRLIVFLGSLLTSLLAGPWGSFVHYVMRNADAAVFRPSSPLCCSSTLCHAYCCGYGRATLLCAHFQCILAPTVYLVRPRRALNFIGFTPAPLSILRLRVFIENSRPLTVWIGPPMCCETNIQHRRGKGMNRSIFRSKTRGGSNTRKRWLRTR